MIQARAQLFEKGPENWLMDEVKIRGSSRLVLDFFRMGLSSGSARARLFRARPITILHNKFAFKTKEACLFEVSTY